MAPPPLLALNDARYRIGDQVILDGASLGVARGERLCLVGRNGAGKSTLLRAVMGLLPNLSGKVFLDGKEITGRQPHAIANLGIAYVPEGRGILNSLTVRENILLAIDGARPRSKDSTEAVLDETARRFPVIGRRLDQPAGQLSGGEQQMLAIARSLAWVPSVLLIDEPTLGLAPKIRMQLSEEISRVATETGVSILLAEQDARFAAACASRAYVLHLGSVADALAGAEIAETDRLNKAYLGPSPSRRPER